ncbi:MAG: aminopeptidase, partial [Thiohalomonadales bacterium]
YYSQSVFGHLGLMMQREDITELLQKDEIPEKLKKKLRFVMEVRQFATEILHLADNDSYTTYVDTQQAYVIWNVVAAPELSLKLTKWCFVFAGCISYKGYYAHSDATDYAETLREEGFDVYVRGATAYSTLGWFDDPVLNTFINYSGPNLAGIIFHELAHQKLYVKNDSAFNESFATFVEKEGVRLWLASQDADPQALQKYQQHKQRRKDFNHLIVDTNERLRKVYSGSESDQEKRAQKKIQIEQLQHRYSSLKQKWGGYTGYDAWMARGINNAQLGSVGTYQDWLPAFQGLFAANEANLLDFYRAAEALSELTPEQRDDALKEYSAMIVAE